MIFISYYKIKPENLIAAMKRFTSGDPEAEMPEGTKLIGRYHNAATTSGVAIIESDTVEAAMRWAMKWNDLMDITLDPVVEDEVVGQMCVEKLTALGEM